MRGKLFAYYVWLALQGEGRERPRDDSARGWPKDCSCGPLPLSVASRIITHHFTYGTVWLYGMPNSEIMRCNIHRICELQMILLACQALLYQ